VVPLHLRIDGVESKALLSDFDLRIALPSANSSVVVNAGGHGYLRVGYDNELRGRVLGELHTLTVIDRYNLVDDAWNEVVAGRLAAADFLTFVEGFSADRDLPVWQSIAIGLRGVGRLLQGDAYAAFQRRVAALVRPVLADLGWEPAEGEADLRSKLRGLLVGTLAVLGDDADTQARCRAILDGASTDPELIAAATNAVAAKGTDADYEAFLAEFRRAATPQDQLRHLYALAEFPQAAQIERTVELAFSGEVRTQNAPFLLLRCIANRHHGVASWQALRQRWAEANERFPGSTIVRMIDPVKLLTAPDVVADVQSFFSEHPIPQAKKGLDQVLERQRVNAALLARESERLPSALQG
jgi:aminopeptidase N